MVELNLQERALAGQEEKHEGSRTDSKAADAEPHVFNEQTNYVPTRTIITVRDQLANATSIDTVTDFPCVRHGRPRRAHGPDDSCSKFVHHRQRIERQQSASLDSIGILCVSIDGLLEAFANRHSTSTCFQLVYGRVSDIWSRKIILLLGLAIFFFGSLASSLAQSALQLIIFRAFTGVAGGGLMTVAQMIVSDVVPLRERGKYQGILVRAESRRMELC